MKTFMRTLFAIGTGMVVAFVLVVAVEWFSAVVHPLPADLEGNIPEHVRRYPHWILGVVVVAWGSIATAATWIASRLGNRVAGIAVALLLASGLIFNLAMLPYTMWFKVVMLSVFPVACAIGITYAKRGPSPVRPRDAALPSNR